MDSYELLQKALESLELQHENLNTLDKDVPMLTKEAIMESTVRRFGICCDFAWMALRKHLIEDFLLPHFADNPRTTFRYAAKHGIVDIKAAERWFQYQKARNSAGHDYEGDFLEQAMNLMPDFIMDAQSLVKAIKETNDD